MHACMHVETWTDRRLQAGDERRNRERIYNAPVGAHYIYVTVEIKLVEADVLYGG